MEKTGNVDYYGTEQFLTDEEKLFRDRVRMFVDQECMPIIADHFDQGTFPMKLIPRMAEMGLFGIHVEGYECRKANHTIYGLICQELGRCDSGLRAMFSVQNSLVMFPIYAFGAEEQKGRWLPAMARGEVIGCFGLSDRQIIRRGSDDASPDFSRQAKPCEGGDENRQNGTGYPWGTRDFNRPPCDSPSF
jgi:glutaryl-CoA dehydrogenase